MQYNVKITNYCDDVQVNYYKDIYDRSDKDDKTIQSNINNNKPKSRDNIQSTWYNPKNGKIEIIPDGFQVVKHPITFEDMLFIHNDLMEKDVFYPFEYELLKPIVDRRLEEVSKKKEIRSSLNSIRRTKQTIYNIARANNWDLFVTFTFNNDEFRNDFDKAKKYFSKKINNVKFQYNLDFKYLLIPEQDKNGNWHFHGLFNNIKGLKLKRAINPHTGKPIKKNNMQVYNIKEFESVGFNTATYVQNNVKVTRYVLKYITKEMEFNFPGKRKYLCSKGLSRGEEAFFLVESENDIMDCLETVYGYDLTFASERVSVNPYTQNQIKYKQYRR